MDERRTVERVNSRRGRSGHQRTYLHGPVKLWSLFACAKLEITLLLCSKTYIRTVDNSPYDLAVAYFAIPLPLQSQQFDIALHSATAFICIQNATVRAVFSSRGGTAISPGPWL
ncbi:hypothetical protein A0H81_14302 [Grifola frondosa]|uniref:Uncharacterized protein n=1 Tax=Grifola frondosa TaxID=5627 RepID=A0A1C7LLU8_GRIFR|nr:hypothetical protein A0H81_14302 [Grifola frondosa]